MMRIREFTIDRFGVLHDQFVPDLSPGITVFLGDNEAGKSTCLNFFRAMLFGYARSRRSIDYLTNSKALSGGTLCIESDSLGTVRLTRRPGPHGGPVTMANEDGSPRPASDLDVLLRGCTPDLYDKVFAFSLGELMHFGSLTDEGIRHALHGAAFGTGLRSPGQALKELDDAMRALFAPRASTAKINKLLAEMDQVNAAVRDRGNEVERYAALKAELEEAAADLERHAAARAGAETARRLLERTAVLRRRWEQLLAAGDELAALPEVAGTFAPDGRERLDRLLDRLGDRNAALSAASLALDRARAEIASLAFDKVLADAAPALFSLSGGKERAREAAAGIAALLEERRGLEKGVAGVCADLGPDWDAARLADCDVSLAAYERAATLGRALREAEQAARAAESERVRLEREKGAAAKAVDDTREALARAGDTASALTGDTAFALAGDDAAGLSSYPLPEEAAQDRLQQLLVRASDAHEKTGTLALAARNAEHALDQAAAATAPGWARRDIEAVELTPAAREILLSLARTARKAASAALEREREEKSAAMLHADAASRVAALQASVAAQAGRILGAVRAWSRADGPGAIPDAGSNAEGTVRNDAGDHEGGNSHVPAGSGPTLADAAAALDDRRRAVRRAQAARKTLDAALVSYASANEQLGDIATLIRGSRKKSAFPWAAAILFLAALCLVCGGGALYMGLSASDDLMARAGTGLFAGGGALGLAWLALFLRGDAGPSEEAERNWAAIEQRLVRARIAASTAREEAETTLETLAAAMPDLFPGGAADAETLAEAEQDLAAGRERLAVLERENAGLERETAAMAEAAKRLVMAGEALDHAVAAADRAREEWEAALAAHGLPETTPPEDARFLLERFDTAKARRAALAGRLAEQEDARERIAECLRFARSFPDLADALASIPEPDSHLAPDHGPWLELARDHLARWRGAGRERIRLRELLAERSARLAETSPLLDAAVTACRVAGQTLESARAAWESWLTGQGLAPSLSPETARMALDAAQKARADLESIRRLDARLAAARAETATFAASLAAFAPLLPDHPGSRKLAGIYPVHYEHSLRRQDIHGDFAHRETAAQAGAEPLAGVAPLSDDPRVMGLLLSLLDALVAKAREAGEKAAVLRNREREMPALADAVSLAGEQVEATRSELDELLSLGRADSPEHFRRAHAAWSVREEARVTFETIRAGLEREAAEAGLDMAALDASFRDDDAAGLARQLEAADAALAETSALERAAAERKGGLETAMRGLMREKGHTALLARRESLLEDIREKAAEWSRLALAREILLTAKGKFESERQTGVVKTAGGIFSRVTNGAYTGLTVSLDDETVRALAGDGAARNAETELSRGAREQLYLALRLAYVRDHGAQAEKLPVIMDDILVNFDAKRARATAGELAAFAGEHQALFFTCHGGTADMLREASGRTRMYRLEKGRFVNE